jgi:hypothetical protein
MSGKRIDRSFLAKLGRAAADNAIALANEADLLDENGHRARAFALTVLAAEELGKAYTCAMAEANVDDPKTWDSFWESWTAVNVMLQSSPPTSVLSCSSYSPSIRLGTTSPSGDREVEGCPETYRHDVLYTRS